MNQEHGRVFRDGKGPWRTIIELVAYFAVAGVILPFLRPASYAESFAIAVIGAAFFTLLILALSRSRMIVTAGEVQIRGLLQTQVIPRGQIAEVVHIRRLQVMGIPKGYLGLLDREGKPLWRTTTEKWPESGIDDLSHAGGQTTLVDEMGPKETSARWPQLLPWSLANPMKAFWGTFGIVLVLTLVGGVAGIIALS